MFFYFFLSVGARVQVSFFLPNFEVIRTKKFEMEPVYIACFGRGEEFFVSFTFVQFFRDLQSFSSLFFTVKVAIMKSCYSCYSLTVLQNYCQ